MNISSGRSGRGSGRGRGGRGGAGKKKASSGGPNPGEIRIHVAFLADYSKNENCFCIPQHSKAQCTVRWAGFEDMDKDTLCDDTLQIVIDKAAMESRMDSEYIDHKNLFSLYEAGPISFEADGVWFTKLVKANLDKLSASGEYLQEVLFVLVNEKASRDQADAKVADFSKKKGAGSGALNKSDDIETIIDSSLQSIRKCLS